MSIRNRIQHVLKKRKKGIKDDIQEKKEYPIVGCRERVEWLNVWFDDANHDRKDRILLIGDSTCRQYRGKLSEISGRPVDLFASTFVDTERLWKWMDCFFQIEEYRQEICQIQIGYHGIEGVGDNNYTFPLDSWIDFYDQLIKKTLQFIPRITIATATHIMQPPSYRNIDERIDAIIRERNMSVIDLASKYQLPVNDLYNYMLTEGRLYKHTDPVHFEHDSDVFIAEKVLECLTSCA